MPYTLGQAAKAVGKSKPTIARAIRSGRLSASRAPKPESSPSTRASCTACSRLPATVPAQCYDPCQGKRRQRPWQTFTVERDRLLAEREDPARDDC